MHLRIKANFRFAIIIMTLMGKNKFDFHVVDVDPLKKNFIIILYFALRLFQGNGQIGNFVRGTKLKILNIKDNDTLITIYVGDQSTVRV